MDTLRYFSFHKIITFVRKYNINVWLYLIKLRDQIVQAIDDTEDHEDISMTNLAQTTITLEKNFAQRSSFFLLYGNKKSQFQNHNLQINKSSQKRGDRVTRYTIKMCHYICKEIVANPENVHN
jgi:hypothetical protein